MQERGFQDHTYQWLYPSSPVSSQVLPCPREPKTEYRSGAFKLTGSCAEEGTGPLLVMVQSCISMLDPMAGTEQMASAGLAGSCALRFFFLQQSACVARRENVFSHYRQSCCSTSGVRNRGAADLSWWLCSVLQVCSLQKLCPGIAAHAL